MKLKIGVKWVKIKFIAPAVLEHLIAFFWSRLRNEYSQNEGNFKENL